MGLPISDSAITNLDFSVLFDISGAIPKVTLNNLSTVITPSHLNWWFVISTPSGTFIHQGTQTSPDITAGTWSTYATPDNAWPLVFGSGACAQVEFSAGAPYSVTVFVQDTSSSSAPWSLTYTGIITRPNGNRTDSCGNFGQANIGVQVQCNNSGDQIYAYDRTSYVYGPQVAPQSSTNQWTLVYPMDDTGNVPANGVATNATNVYFPATVAGDGYAIYLSVISIYLLSANVSVKVQYKSNQNNKVSVFGVWCGLDLCLFNFEIQKLLQLTKDKCGQLENSELNKKLLRCTSYFALLTQCIVQPLCNIDVNALRAELERELGLQEGCSCRPIGINPGNPSSDTPPPSGCCSLDDTLGVGNVTNKTAKFQTASNNFTWILPTGIDIQNLTLGDPQSALMTAAGIGLFGLAFASPHLRQSEFTYNQWIMENLDTSGGAPFTLTVTPSGIALSGHGGDVNVLIDSSTGEILLNKTSAGISASLNVATGQLQFVNATDHISYILDLGAGTILLEDTTLSNPVQTIVAPGSHTYKTAGSTNSIIVRAPATIVSNANIVQPDDSGTYELSHVSTFSGSSGATLYTLPHGLSFLPSAVFITFTDSNSATASLLGWWVTWDSTNIYLHFLSTTGVAIQGVWKVVK